MDCVIMASHCTYHIVSIVQDCDSSIANALELFMSYMLSHAIIYTSNSMPIKASLSLVNIDLGNVW